MRVLRPRCLKSHEQEDGADAGSLREGRTLTTNSGPCSDSLRMRGQRPPAKPPKTPCPLGARTERREWAGPRALGDAPAFRPRLVWPHPLAPQGAPPSLLAAAHVGLPGAGG